MSEGGSKAPSADGKGKTKNRVATAKDLLGPRIMLGQQPAVGLFVLFAPVPTTLKDASAGADGQAAPAQEGNPGLPSPPKFTACFIDGQGYPQTVSPGTNPWSQIAKQLENLAALRKRAKDNGFSGPVVADKPCANPHAFKLVDGASYQLCLVSHPNPELALAMQAYLNEGKADPRFKFPKKEDVVFEVKLQTDDDQDGKVAHIDLPTEARRYWPPGHARYGGWVLYQDMPHATVAGVKAAVSLLASDLASLRYPTGEDGNCPYPTAKEHSGHFGLTMMATVHAFQQDAAAGNALKRMTTAEADAGKLSGSWSYLLAGSAKASEAKPADALASVLPVAAEPVKSDESEDIAWKWDWTLDGDAPKLAAEEKLGVGVVTATVGDAIAKWKESGYLKTGPILVQSNLQTRCWARPELAISLALWNLMAKALGCAYGIKLLCTFRELTVPAGVGRVECSNHKLGLSVDLLSHQFRHTHRQWPIHYEADWVPSTSSVVQGKDKEVAAAEAKLKEASQKRAKAEAYLAGLDSKEAAGKRLRSGEREAGQSSLQQRIQQETEANENLGAKQKAAAELGGAVEAAKSNYLLLWRLYGHSSLNVWAAAKDTEDPDGEWTPVPTGDLQAALAGSDSFGVTSDGGGPWGIETRMGELVRGFFPSTSDPAAEAAIDKIVADAQTKARKIAQKLYGMAGDTGDKGLVACLFRRTIRPFDYNPFEADGGTSLPAQTVDTDAKLSDAKTYFGESPIRSYLNLTRLGFHCGMTRISAQRLASTGTFKRPDSDPEYSPKVAPKSVVFNLIPDEKRKKGRPAKDISAMLEVLAQHLDDLAKTPEAGKPQVVLDDGKTQTVELTDLDKAFVKEWATLMDPAARHCLSFEDLSLSLALSADKDAFDAKLKNLDSVTGKKFQLVGAGKMLGMDAEVGKQLPLRGWLDDVAELWNKLFGKAAGADRKIEGENGKKPRGKVAQSNEKASPDWSLVLFPLFGKGAPKARRVVQVILCPCGAPAPLEWWHHDNKAMSGPWAEMAEAVGYSGTVVRAVDAPPETVVNGQYEGGLGFDPKRADKVRTPPTTAPENWSKIPEGG